MIEFKAECGHTIRAKDGDEGKVVRCSYCGRTTQVPDKADDEFASLFSDVVDAEAGESVSAGETVKPRRRRPVGVPKPTRKSDSGSGFNPFALVLKMAYAAAIVIVLIVCAKAVYNHWTRDQGRKPPRQPTPSSRAQADQSQPSGRTSPSKPGPQTTLPSLKSNNGGMYITSVPKGAQVRYRRADREHGQEEIFLDPDAERANTPCKLQIAPGPWEVAVALRIDSPELNRYDRYQDQRRYAEETDDGGPLANFFLPDEAEEFAMVDLSKGRLLGIRKYSCQVTKNEWYLLTALFLPDQPVSDLLPYLPAEMVYGFKEDYVTNQLSYRQVSEVDRTYVVDALRRVGMVVYRYPESGDYRCFRIGLDGNLDSWPCEDHRGGW